MNPYQAYGTIVGLVMVNEWDTFADVARRHPLDFAPSALPDYQEIGDIVSTLLSEYDFIESAVFMKSVAGRNDVYTRTKARFESEPTKRRAHRDRFAEALRELLASDAAFDLAAQSEWPKLDRIRQLVKGIEDA